MAGNYKNMGKRVYKWPKIMALLSTIQTNY